MLDPNPNPNFLRCWDPTPPQPSGAPDLCIGTWSLLSKVCSTLPLPFCAGGTTTRRSSQARPPPAAPPAACCETGLYPDTQPKRYLVGPWTLNLPFLCRWDPNPPQLSSAPAPCGATWSLLPPPVTGPLANTTYNSQPTFVLPYECASGRTVFMYLGDRWNFRGPGGVRAVSSKPLE